MKTPQWLRVLLWIVLIFLIYAIFRSPEDAATIVVGGIDGIAAGISAIFRFFDAVLGRLNDGGVASGPSVIAAAFW